MPRYFFHVRDGIDIPDEDGTFCPGLPEARAIAIETAGAMIKDLGAKSWTGRDVWQMTVTDEAGVLQFMLRFAAGDLNTPSA